MSTIEQNLQAVRDSIAQAAAEAQRAPADVTLLAVSKTFGADAVLAAMRAGQAAFGENYLQEALDKIALVKEAAPQHVPAWHFIGPIQSNKTRPIAEHFDWVHTVEREKIAARLSEQRPAGLPDLNICLQVNISGEASKSGVTPAELPALAHAV
ncbi:MAG: YggS family pyridoxal phosphate-dependent enzyme, partial [Janthinobacterium sp.]